MRSVVLGMGWLAVCCWMASMSAADVSAADDAVTLKAAEGDITIVQSVNNGSSKSQGRDWPYNYTAKAEVRTADLLPASPVKTGDSWDLPAEAAKTFGGIFKETPNDTLECAVKCTLEEVKEGKAKIKVAVTMSVMCKRKAGGPGGRIERTLKADPSGTMTFDTATGKITAADISKQNFAFTEQYKNNYISDNCPGKGNIKITYVASKAGEATEKKEEPKGPETGKKEESK